MHTCDLPGKYAEKLHWRCECGRLWKLNPIVREWFLVVPKGK
jgi:hypothetical protein